MLSDTKLMNMCAHLPYLSKKLVHTRSRCSSSPTAVDLPLNLETSRNTKKLKSRACIESFRHFGLTKP